MPFRRQLLLLFAALALSACFGTTKPVSPTLVTAPAPLTLKIGLALGGGAAKGFAHIGVIKMLEASGIHPDVVSGTSAGASLVRCMPAHERVSAAGAGVCAGRGEDSRHAFFLRRPRAGTKLEDYINAAVNHRSIQELKLPFAAVATQLETGERSVFIRGNTGQAVRASSSIPGVFEPVLINGKHYVDGGVVSPVPVTPRASLARIS